MEEQTTQQTQQEQSQQSTANIEQDYPQQDLQDSVTLPEDTPEPEIGLTEDGEVKFKDGFFGEEETETPAKQEPAPQPEKQVKQELYSPDELRSIPFESWDRAKLPDEIAMYYDAVKSQLTTRHNVEQVRNAPMPNVLGEEPKPYTAKELVEDANKLAMERLGVKEDDFDPDYDAEHRAAVDLAKNELIQQRNYNILMYRQRSSEMNELRDFNTRLVSVPDFDGFSKWYDNALQQIGKTNAQVQNELINVARQYGAREVMRIMTGWYRTYKQQESQQATAQAQQQPAPKVKTPPPLERTQGGNSNNRKSYNMRDFSQLDDDAQAQALMDMGIV